MSGERKNRTSGGSSSGLRALLLGAVLVAVVLFLFGVYSMVRLTALRVSADYYFPYLKLAQKTENWVADQTLLAQDKMTLIRALQNLMTENSVLSAERSVISDLKRENGELRAMLQLGRREGFRPVFAEVIARDPRVWQEQFTIDKGSLAGIQPGNLVVVQVFSPRSAIPVPAVIGKIKSVTTHTAQVSTVLSQDFRISVSLPESKASGILEGSHHFSGSYATLKFLPAGKAPVPGQLVCTNSFSGNSPPGFPVGRVVYAGKAENGITSMPGLPVGRVVSAGGGSPSFSRNQLYQETGVEPFESPAEVRFVAVYAKDVK